MQEITARYRNGQIIAKKNSLGYYHEQRHFWQDQMHFLLLNEFFYWFAGFLTLLYWNPLPMLFQILASIALELDAWGYALKQQRLNT